MKPGRQRVMLPHCYWNYVSAAVDMMNRPLYTSIPLPTYATVSTVMLYQPQADNSTKSVASSCVTVDSTIKDTIKFNLWENTTKLFTNDVRGNVVYFIEAKL